MGRAAHYQGSVSSDVVAGGTEIVALDGELDLSNVGEFEQYLSEASGPYPTDILVDLRGVRSLDSGMLRALLRALTRANERGAGFALIRPNALVWRVFILTGLSVRFLSYATLHEALSGDLERV